MKDSYDLFISYRRGSGSEMAKLLRDLFVSDNYSVFFDEDSHEIGELGGILEQSIKRSRLFVLVISKGCFEKILDGTISKDDNYWREISYAIKEKGANGIIPVLTPDARSTKILPNINEEFTIIKSLRYIRYNGELGNLMGGFYKELKDSITNHNNANRAGNHDEGSKASKPNRHIIPIVTAFTAILLGIGIWWFTRGSSATIVPKQTPPEDAYTQALAMITSTDSTTFIKGYQMMDSLSNTLFIPAMYQIAFTHGWYSDPESLRRKDLLGIQYERQGTNNQYRPINEIDNRKEMSIIDKILQLGDTNYASVNADVAFRMAAHYTNSYQNIQKGLEYLNIAHDWAERAQDTCLLRKIQESKETFR